MDKEGGVCIVHCCFPYVLSQKLWQLDTPVKTNGQGGRIIL